MRLSLRIFLGFFLIVALAAYFVLAIFMQEVRPGVRQGMEVALVDTANLLAEIAGEEMRTGRLSEARFAQTLKRYRQRNVKARIWGVTKQHADFRVYVTDERGRLLFDSEGDAPGADYSRWNDVYLTLHGQYGVRSTRVDPKDENTSVMHVAAPILDQGRLVGVLTVATPTASVVPFAKRSERRVYRAGLALAGAALLIGIGLSLWLSGAIDRLRSYARKVSEGQKAVLPPLSGELAELGQALETMRERLEGRQYVERYVHTLTHEMKSPLAAIHGAAELLDEEMPLEDRQRFLAHIREQEERLRQLVDRMLGLATVESRQRIEKPERILLAPLAERVCVSKEALCTRRNIGLDCTVSLDCSVEGDAFLIEQALSNLLDNALDFSPEGSRIELVCVTDHNCHALHVKDQGPGIPDYAAGRIFEPFYSLPRPSTGRKSTGLGLSFVREVAELHGGSITLENRVDGGVEASLRLPVA
jgi:two-component system, OmpR family, sensor histidine kinase CreC